MIKQGWEGQICMVLDNHDLRGGGLAWARLYSLTAPRWQITTSIGPDSGREFLSWIRCPDPPLPPLPLQSITHKAPRDRAIIKSAQIER